MAEQKTPDPPKRKLQINFNTTPSDEKETKNAYEHLNLFKTANNPQQKALWKLLTIGRISNYPQLLLLLFSDYSRQRIRHFISTQTLLPMLKWMESSPAVKEMMSGATKYGHQSFDEIITAAINLFQTRLCHPMKFSLLPQEKINDSIPWFTKQISEGIKLIKNKNWLAPCQLDLWIVPFEIGSFPKCTVLQNSDTSEAIESDSDCDFDSCSEDEIECIETNEGIQESVLNIEKHIQCTMDETEYICHHNLSKLRKQFMQKILSDTQCKRYCMIVERIKKSSDNIHMFEDQIHMYIPAYERQIPNGNMCEWGINATLSDILPESKCGKYPKLSAKDSLNGKMFVLSLQKSEGNEIRAWLYHRNTMTRFYPSDIVNILPYLFVKQKRLNLQTYKCFNRLNSIPDSVFDHFSHRKHNSDGINEAAYNMNVNIRNDSIKSVMSSSVSHQSSSSMEGK